MTFNLSGQRCEAGARIAPPCLRLPSHPGRLLGGQRSNSQRSLLPRGRGLQRVSRHAFPDGGDAGDAGDRGDVGDGGDAGNAGDGGTLGTQGMRGIQGTEACRALGPPRASSPGRARFPKLLCRRLPGVIFLADFAQQYDSCSRAARRSRKWNLKCRNKIIVGHEL